MALAALKSETVLPVCVINFAVFWLNLIEYSDQSYA